MNLYDPLILPKEGKSLSLNIQEWDEIVNKYKEEEFENILIMAHQIAGFLVGFTGGIYSQETISSEKVIESLEPLCDRMQLLISKIKFIKDYFVSPESKKE